MERVYIVSGANGHLGRNILTKLVKKGRRVRGLLLPGEELYAPLRGRVEIFYGDVRDKESLRPLFEGLEGAQVAVIHTAAVVEITTLPSQRAREVNVEGTKNMIALSLAYGAWRYVHVSSVHAIPEPEDHRVIREVDAFDPDEVRGGYAKTKAEASQLVLDAVREAGLPAVILHPSGIIGPLDGGANNLMNAMRGFLDGSLPACPTGGYDLVDVRDVAGACIAAVDKGRVGQAYILSGRHYEMADVFAMLQKLARRPRALPCPVVPSPLVKLVSPLVEKLALRQGKSPLITPYSMDALNSHDNFSHKKASRELGYWPRDIADTLRDTLRWLEREQAARRIAVLRSAAARRVGRKTAGPAHA